MKWETSFLSRLFDGMLYFCDLFSEFLAVLVLVEHVFVDLDTWMSPVWCLTGDLEIIQAPTWSHKKAQKHCCTTHIYLDPLTLDSWLYWFVCDRFLSFLCYYAQMLNGTGVCTYIHVFTCLHLHEPHPETYPIVYTSVDWRPDWVFVGWWISTKTHPE